MSLKNAAGRIRPPLNLSLWRGAFYAFPAWAVIGCGQEPAGGAEKVTVAIRDGSGRLPAEFRAIAAPDDGAIMKVTCKDGAGAAGSLVCTREGVEISGEFETLDVFIKARGMWFETRQYKKGGDSELAVDLDPLGLFTVNDDYRTGFDAESGLDDFLNMAYSVETELGPSYVVKFYIADIKGKREVYFQNTRKHRIHYDFVRNILGIAVTGPEFEQTTYHGADRSAMAGSLIYYPKLAAQSRALGGKIKAPIVLSFFPYDDLTADQALLAHRLIEERLGFAALGGGARRLAYQPAGAEQEEDATDSARAFDRADALWVSLEELYAGLSLQIMNPGLAYGTLRRLSPDELSVAVVSFSDILLLTRLPVELPIVGGTITEELQTPLAHVNVAARARGTPNIALLGASEDPRVAPFINKLVRFEVKQGGFTLQETTQAEADEFRKARAPDQLAPVFDLAMEGLPGFESLKFDDAVSVGSKAANLAELKQLLGDRTPAGFAVPFHYYDDFMRASTVSAALCDKARADCVDEGRAADLCDRAQALCATGSSAPDTLRQYAERLIGNPEFRGDTELRDACLDNLRYLIGHTEADPGFGAALDARVAEVFDEAKARLRSSTNAEDLPRFSGAGLYDSVSAYASGDQAASSRIRKVWASVWNFRAFEERAFWNIDHLAVYMGVAVSQAFENEAANGVLITQNIANPATAGMYVNVQQGEVSVTNPSDGAIPEVFSIIPSPAGGIQVARLRYSSLSPDQPLLSDAEIEQLYDAAYTVQKHFAPLYHEDPNVLAMDIEFKFNEPDRGLFIKQARPYFQSGLGSGF